MHDGDLDMGGDGAEQGIPAERDVPEATAEQVSVELLGETFAAARRLCWEHGWNEDMGLAIILETGLCFLLHQQPLSQVSEATDERAAEINRLSRLLIETESKTAVMAYQAYVEGCTRQALETTVEALRREHETVLQTLLACRTEEARLREAIAAERTRQAEASAPAEPAGFWERVQRALGQFH